MAIFQTITDILVGAQTEITIFLIAIVAHTLLFGKYRISNGSAKSKKGFQKGSPKQRSTHPKMAREKELGTELARSVKNLVLQGAHADAIENEIYRQVPQTQLAGAIDTLAEFLDQLGRNATVEVVTAVREVIDKNGLRVSGRFGELLLRICFSLHLTADFKELLAEMEGSADTTPTVAVLALRAELATGDIDATLRCVQSFAAQWRACVGPTPSAGPQGVMQQVVRLAAEKGACGALLQQLCDCNLLTPWTVQAILVECGRRGDVDALREAEALARSKNVEFTPAACCALVQAATSDSEVVKLYERHLTGADTCADTSAARRVVEAAFRGQRLDIIKQLMASSKESAKQAALVKSFGADHHSLPSKQPCMAEASAVFQACPAKSSVLFNTFLGICIDCGDKKAMERTMAEAQAAGLADVVTYNTIVKAYSSAGDFRRAFAAMESMSSAGLAPNQVTFNELIDATIKRDVDGAWSLIDQMGVCGLKPNRVTCSILLKTVQRGSRSSDIERTFAVLGSLDEEMDEVLLSSACEACVRIGRADLLTRQLKRQRSSKSITVASAHTFGSLIRGHGYIRDTAGAWETWKDMMSRHVVPTSITIGCMVEALVSNGETDAGYDLIGQLLGEEKTRPLVNAIVYCSVLKGFSHERRFERVWDVYEEMRTNKMQFSIVTYNALIDACARSRQMTRAKALLSEMGSDKIEPNTVTYSTIIKGYCNDGRLEQALELLQEMKQSKKIRPDEVTYNTILDGCARLGLFDRGVALLNEMEEDGVPPSNFTLSLLAKLATRSKLPDKAFELCEKFSRKYNIRLNVHVYNNLIQACTGYGDCKRALGVLAQMCQEKVRPDARTYTLLLRSCVSTKQAQHASDLLRAAFGLRSANHAALGLNVSFTQLREGLPSDLISEILEGLSTSCGDVDLALLLLKDLSKMPGVKLDSKLSMRLTAKAIKSSA